MQKRTLYILDNSNSNCMCISQFDNIPEPESDEMDKAVLAQNKDCRSTFIGPLFCRKKVGLNKVNGSALCEAECLEKNPNCEHLICGVCLGLNGYKKKEKYSNMSIGY